MYDLLNSVVIDAQLKNKVNRDDNNIESFDERKLALIHLKEWTKDDIVVFDRGYVGYELMAQNRINYVMRIKKQALKKLNFYFLNIVIQMI